MISWKVPLHRLSAKESFKCLSDAKDQHSGGATTSDVGSERQVWREPLGDVGLC